jgi:hypothetical protein
MMQILIWQYLQRNWLFVLLAFLGCNSSALAETGSAQATMVFIVPSNPANSIALDVPHNEYSPYVADTSTTVMEQGGDVMYKVWISI